jgi:hypothetical protein
MIGSSVGEAAAMFHTITRRWRGALLVLLALGLCYGCWGCLASALNTNRAPTDIDWSAVRAQDVVVTSADWGAPELVVGTRGYEDAPSAHGGVLYFIYVQNLPKHDFGPNLDPQGLCKPYGMDWHCGWFPRADLFTIRGGGSPVAHPLTVSSSPKGGAFLVGKNLYHHADNPANLYVAPDAGGTPVQLSTVNTKGHKDVNPWVDATETLLLFESNRPGAGDFDLYVSQRKAKDAPWSEPVMLPFCTKLGDRMPFLHTDGYLY